MRAVVLSFLLCFAAFAVATEARADETYADGYTTPSGYVYQSGLWYYGAQPYTRTLYSRPAYYVGCNYYPASYYYAYYPAPVTKITPQTPNALVALVGLAKQRDRLVLEGQNFVEAVKILGLEGNLRIANYATHYSPGSYFNNQFLGHHGVSGNTLYAANTVRASADIYGATNLDTLYQSMFRTTDHLIQAGSQGATQVAGITSQVTAGAATVAEINAKRDALVAAIVASGQAVRPESRATITTTGTTVAPVQPAPAQPPPSPNGNGVQGPLTAQPRRTPEALVKVATEKCVGCHAGEKIKGNFDVTKWITMSPEAKAKAWERLMTQDASKMMPRDPEDETKPGQRLTPEEMRAFLLN